MYVERRCGRVADSNTGDVSRRSDARAASARSINGLVKELRRCSESGGCSALRIGSDCGGVRDGTDETFTICPSRQSGQYETMRRASSAIT
jgi:hypothetical protein